MLAKEQFKSVYNYEAEVVAHAPGRLEILGNHTDYNEGHVLSMAVDCGTTMAFRSIEGSVAYAFSKGIGDGVRELPLDDLREPLEAGDWLNYLRGVLVEMQKSGVELKAFELMITSDIPRSAGMSSSAALEMAMVTGLEALYGIEIPILDKAKIGQGTENHYIGANTGMMDQVSSLCGKKGMLVHSEYRDLVIKHQSLPNEYVMIVANSGVEHDLTGDYNSRREQCHSAAKKMGAQALRDVSLEELESHRDDLDELEYLRALHVVSENARVLEAAPLLASGDFAAFGQLLYDSHHSSIHHFENSCSELDEMVNFSKQHEHCLGARLSGGGFGGISIHLVAKENAEVYQKDLAGFIQNHLGITPQVMVCAAANGAQIL